MFRQLATLLFANVIFLSYGIPLGDESQYNIKRFLSPRIIGGVDAPPGYGKHMAALVYGDIATLLVCGGSIITKHNILTAAHCTESMTVWGQLLPSFRAVVGSHKWASTENNIGFKGHINHPDFSWDTLKNDISVLILAETIKLTDNVAIIPLSFDWVDGGTKSYVTGWGYHQPWMFLPDTLQLLYVHVISPWRCAQLLLEISEWWGVPPPYDPALEICTLHSYGHGMCYGDSGSALVEKDTQKQIGIVSWGFPCALGAPDMFVRVSAFKEFILKILHHF